MKEPYNLHMVYAGSLWLDGGAVFGIVPKPLWSKHHKADERNRILCATYCLLIQGNGRTILVDTGCGTLWSEKERWIYSIEYCLLNSLENLGIQTDSITDVILTHLHFDHVGGSVTMVDGRLTPTFPRATYYVQRKQWEWAIHPSEKDRGSYRPQQFLPLKESGQLVLLEGESELFQGIFLLVTNGHTVAHQMVKIFKGGTTYLFCGDFLPYTTLLPLPYIMAYDNQPLVTLQEKKEILQQAADQQWVLLLEHDPSTRAITIQHGERGFEVSQVLTHF